MQCLRGVCYHESINIKIKFSEIIRPNSTWWRETAEQTEQVQPNEASGRSSRCVVKMGLNNEASEAKSTFQCDNKTKSLQYYSL